MTLGERACNWLLGLSAIGWAVRGMVGMVVDGEWSAAPPILAALNLLVGCLFLVRAPLQISARPWQLMAAAPSFVLGGLTLKLAAAEPWPWYSQVLFASGGLLTLSALATLGRSFAILPGIRHIVARGPYRMVRHPAYAGECLMLAAACSAGPTAANVVSGVAALALLIVRIYAEESVLQASAEYRAYAETHRWRLAPRVW